MGVGTKRNSKGPGKTKVRQFQVAFPIDKEILRLQVAVQDAMTVTVANTLDELAHELLDHGLSETKPVHVETRAVGQSLPTPTLADRQSFHVLLQVKVEKLKDEVKLVAIGVDDVEEAHDVGVTHLLQERNLADRSRGNTFIFGFETNLLQRNNAAIVGKIAGFVDDTIGSCQRFRTR